MAPYASLDDAARARTDRQGPDHQQTLLDTISHIQTDGIVRVAIDGDAGAGKTHLADELAVLCEASGRATIRASVDGFHNPRTVRYQRGRNSAEFSSIR